MICYVCREEIKDFDGCVICKKCEEASYLCSAMDFSFEHWSTTLAADNLLWNNTKKFVGGLSNKIDKSKDIVDQSVDLMRILTDTIKHHLRIYNKDELIIALLTIKEAVRRLQIKTNKRGLTWRMISEYELAIQFIDFALQVPDTEFAGAPIGSLEDGFSNLITAISLGRVYIILKENVNLIKFIKIDNLDIKKLAFEPIETDETENYYKDYLEMGVNEKPEDYKIENVYLKEKLKKEGKTSNQIANHISSEIIDKFGFNIDFLKVFSMLAQEEFPEMKDFFAFCDSKEIYHDEVPKLAIFKKSVLKEQVFNSFDERIFENIIHTFSINMVNLSNELDTVRSLELRSIYEKDDLIVFGRIDLMQNISAFEKFALSGHYIEYFNPELKDNKLITEAQRKLSSFLSYVIADRLCKNGYKLPMEKLGKKLGGEFVPRAEIKKIEVNNKNILQDVGDIDVLALDEIKNQILLFEFKHYKPAISIKDLIRNDKSKIEDEEILRKIKARKDAVKRNIRDVVSFFGWDNSKNYSVKSILVTSRPNYYACNYINDIEYVTWIQLIDKINIKKL